MLNELKPKELNFVNSCIKHHGDRVAAAKEAGLASTDGSAAVVASRLLRNVKVIEKINEESRVASEAVGLNLERILGRLAQIISKGKDSDSIQAIKVWADLTGSNAPTRMSLVESVMKAPKDPDEIDALVEKMRKNVDRD